MGGRLVAACEALADEARVFEVAWELGFVDGAFVVGVEHGCVVAGVIVELEGVAGEMLLDGVLAEDASGAGGHHPDVLAVVELLELFGGDVHGVEEGDGEAARGEGAALAVVA